MGRQLWVAYMAPPLPLSPVRGLLLLLAALAGQLREGAAWLGAVGPCGGRAGGPGGARRLAWSVFGSLTIRRGHCPDRHVRHVRIGLSDE